MFHHVCQGLPASSHSPNTGVWVIGDSKVFVYHTVEGKNKKQSQSLTQFVIKW